MEFVGPVADGVEVAAALYFPSKGVPSGQIVTLCTCSYEAANYRYVVLGELCLLYTSTAASGRPTTSNPGSPPDRKHSTDTS